MEQSEHGVLGFVDAFVALKETYRPAHIVCERFDLRSSNKFLADLSPVECIGWLKGEAYSVEYVMPSQHKTLVKDRTLNPLMKAGKFKVGAGHSRDALRIALWFAAMRLKHVPSLELLKAKEDSVS
jgi:hypothetical protein